MIHEEDRSNENKFSETVLIFFFEPIVKYVDFQLWLIAELDLQFVPKRLSLFQIDLKQKKKKTFFLFGKKSWVRNVKKPFFQKSLKVTPIGLNH